MPIQNSSTSYSISPLQVTANVFRINIGHLRAENDQYIIDQLDKLKTSGHPSNSSNVQSWHTEWDSHNRYKHFAKDLVSDIFSYVLSPDIRALIFGVTKQDANENSVCIGDSWFSIQEEGEWVREHQHGSNNVFSFCYYIKTENDSAPFVISTYNTNTMHNACDVRQVPFFPKSGELFIFPSWLFHSVPPTKGRRYSYAGNVELNLPKESTISLYDYMGEDSE